MIQLEALRAVANNRTLVLNETGDNLIQNKFLHKFKSFFNLGSAREKNAETLAAIRTAILNDPKFAFLGEDLERRADELLAQVRTTRAINSTQISNILSTLDQEASPVRLRQAMNRRIIARLAATELPPELEGRISKEVYTAIAKNTLGHAAVDSRFHEVDIPGQLERLREEMIRVFNEIGDDPEMLRLVLADPKRHFYTASPDTLYTTMHQVIERFRENLNALPQPPRPEDAATMRALGVDFLVGLGKPCDNRVFPLLTAFAQTLPVETAVHLPAANRPEALYRAFQNMTTALGAPLPNPPPDLRPFDGDELPAAQILSLGMALLRLDGPERAALREILAGEAGQALHGLYVNTFDNTSSQLASHTLALINDALALISGQERVAFPFQAPLRTDLFPATLYTRLSPTTACFTGPGATNFQHLLRNFPVTAETGPHPLAHPGEEAARNFRSVLLPNVRSLLGHSFAAEMRHTERGERTSFEKDIEREMSIFLPDGTRLPNDFAQARDQLAAYLSGNPAATYAGADPALRKRIHVLTSLLSQETIKSIQMGASVSMNGKENTGAFVLLTNGDDENEHRRFDIALTEDGGFEIHFRMHRAFALASILGAPNGNIQAGEGSTESYALDISLTGEEVNRLTRAPWTDYDPSFSDRAQAREALGSTAESYFAIPTPFRLDCDLDAGFKINLVPAQEEIAP